jgi:hypothetical protein
MNVDSCNLIMKKIWKKLIERKSYLDLTIPVRSDELCHVAEKPGRLHDAVVQDGGIMSTSYAAPVGPLEVKPVRALPCQQLGRLVHVRVLGFSKRQLDDVAVRCRVDHGAHSPHKSLVVAKLVEALVELERIYFLT